MSGPTASLVQAAGGDTGLRGIVTALRALGPVSAVNYPAGGAVSTVMREAGAEVTLRQYEMVAAALVERVAVRQHRLGARQEAVPSRDRPSRASRPSA